MLLDGFPVDGLPLSAVRRGTNFIRSHHLRFFLNKVLQIFLQRETSWKWAHFRVRHQPVSASLQCSISFLQPPLPAPLSAFFADSFPYWEQYRLTVFRMERNVSLDAHSNAERFSITKEYVPTSFLPSLPFWPQRINHFRCFSHYASYMGSLSFIILTP